MLTLQDVLDVRNMPEECDARWNRSVRQFEHVVDCRGLATMVNGFSSCEHIGHRRSLAIMINELADVCNAEHHVPRRYVGHPVVWKRRCRNTIADIACNYCMDTEQDFAYMAPDDPTLTKRYIAIQLFSDGGVRDNGRVATGVHGRIWYNNHGHIEHETLFIRGQYISVRMTPFAAEIAALRLAIKMLKLLGTDMSEVIAC